MDVLVVDRLCFGGVRQVEIFRADPRSPDDLLVVVHPSTAAPGQFFVLRDHNAPVNSYVCLYPAPAGLLAAFRAGAPWQLALDELTRLYPERLADLVAWLPSWRGVRTIRRDRPPEVGEVFSYPWEEAK